MASSFDATHARGRGTGHLARRPALPPVLLPACLPSLALALPLLLLGGFLLVPAANAQAQALGGSLVEPELSPDVYLDEAGQAARSYLEQVKEFLANQQWDEAVETLGRVMENEGDKVLALPESRDPASGDFRQYVTLRQWGHLQLVGFHRSAPEALALYRQRVDPLASRWYQEAVAQRDAGKLQRLLDQFFASSYGDDALYRLGEMALEQGDYLRAREVWERISPRLRAPPLPTRDNAATQGSAPGERAPGERAPGERAPGERAPGESAPVEEPFDNGPLWLPGRPLWQAWRGLSLDDHWPLLAAAMDQAAPSPSWLAYPDSELDLADVRARLILVSILEGALERAAWEFDVFRRLHAEATGTIAGRSGPYVDLLATLLDQARQWPAPASSPDWPTFAGGSDRQAVVDRELDIRRRPIWTASLPLLVAANEQLSEHRSRVAEDSRGLLSYHPVVRDGTVFVATGPNIDDIDAFDLQTGRALWRSLPNLPSPDPRRAGIRAGPGGFVPGIMRQQRYVGVPRYTLTSVGNLLLARVGSPVTGGSRDHEVTRDERAAIVAVDVAAERKLLFKLELDGPQWGPNWVFEGTPLSDGSSLFVAVRYQDDVRGQLHVACFDMQSRKLRWRQMVGAAETLGHGQWDERTHCLLTLRSGSLFVNSNLGVVASLRADDGKIRWVTRYRRAMLRLQDSEKEDRHFFRDLTPCLVYRNLVISAPADCDRIFALDAATGQLIWATAPGQATDVVHLLGVGQGNLIVSGDYLYWIQVETGRFVGRFPDAGRDAVKGYGRGQLVGDQIWWPTREAIFVMDQARPRQVRQPIDLSEMGVSGGNLVVSEGVLLIAGADSLVAFNETGRRADSTRSGPRRSPP